MEPEVNPSVTPFFISVTCGQDIEVADLTGTTTILMSCYSFNGSEP